MKILQFYAINSSIRAEQECTDSAEVNDLEVIYTENEIHKLIFQLKETGQESISSEYDIACWNLEPLSGFATRASKLPYRQGIEREILMSIC